MSDLYQLFPTDLNGIPSFPHADTSSLSDVDRDALRELSWPEIQSWVEERIKAHLDRDYIRALKTIHNDAALVHCLSNEVLMMIFEEASSTRADIRVSHVCRRWRSLALATPAFWANLLEDEDDAIDYSKADSTKPFHMETVESVISRSGTRPIQLVLDHFSPAHARILDATRSRVQSLSLIAIDCVNAFRSIASTMGGMPNLTELCIFNWSEGIPDLQQPLWEIDAFPRLRCLYISGTPHTVRYIVPSLRKLFIKGPACTYTAEILLDALRNCPGLERLGILDDAMPPASTSLESFGKVSLPALQSLNIHYPSQDALRPGDLLAHVDLPLTAGVRLKVVETLAVVNRIEYTFPAGFACLPAWPKVTEVHYADEENDWYLISNDFSMLTCWAEGKVVLSIEAVGILSAEELEYLCTHSAATNHFRWFVKALSPYDCYSSVFQALPQLRFLEITCATPGYIDPAFIRQLCFAADPQTTIPCPALKDLFITRALPVDSGHADVIKTTFVTCIEESLRNRSLHGVPIERLEYTSPTSQMDGHGLLSLEDARQIAACLARHVSLSVTIALYEGSDLYLRSTESHCPLEGP
ncbi:hypothetical protein FKP32DRAFT_1598622 [Trametes sanguinea]|nr:hypothetical protein FKP32DRAFT_1598622 [Trametes sanguinea]